MGKRLFVGNLSWDLSEVELEEKFKEIGHVVNVKIVYDHISHKSKGFGFVQMGTEEEAKKAIETFDQKGVLKGRTMVVNEARPPRKKGGEQSGQRTQKI